MGTIKTGGKSRAALGLRGVTLLCSASVLGASFGCNSLDAPIPEPTGERLVIPTDTRAAVTASKTPVPVSGGTLLVTRTGRYAVASDPDRDSVVVADLKAATLLGRIPLNAGDEPGRVVEDSLGRVHVALRRGGAVATIDPASLAVLYRRPVCAAPRGLLVSSTDMLQVACADGKLVTLPTADGAATRTLALDVDLRDVMESPMGLTVTRFKSAEILRVDASGALTRRDHLPPVSGDRSIPDDTQPRDPVFGPVMMPVTQPFKSLVAWRSLAGPNGSTVILHQRAVDAEVEVTPPSLNGSSYGGGNLGGPTCGGISENAVTTVNADGTVSSTVTFAGAPLAVDAALLPSGLLAIVHAGPTDVRTPQPFILSADQEGDQSGSNFSGPSPASFGQTGTVSIVNPADVAGGCQVPVTLAITDPAVAVAAIPNQPTQIVVQTTQPSSLVITDVNNPGFMVTISFDDGATLDTGFQLFHRASSAGIACASCHPEGGEDGNVWTFKDVGARRTQALSVGLRGTAPFHWDGKLAGVGSLMDEVFVGRMGGIHQNVTRLATFENWLFAMKAPVPMKAADDPAVVRGSAIFASAGCKSCHSGSKFSNYQTIDVGTHSAVPLQVPSLIGIGYRAPFIHDGCAPTLFDRFNPACGGGDLHGATSKLTATDTGDLVAYLESL